MENYFVLLGLSISAETEEIDRRIRSLSQERSDLFSAGTLNATKIRQSLSEARQRSAMKKAFTESGTLFAVEYGRDCMIRIVHNLPSYYGEFSVRTSRECLEAGPYDRTFLEERQCLEIGETNYDEDGETYCTAIAPKLSEKYYYPTVKLSIGGRCLYYIIGREENRAFVHNIRTSYSYEAVTVCFDWGNFSKAFYIIAPNGEKILPFRSDTILVSVIPNGGKGKAVGTFGVRDRAQKIVLAEEIETGEYLLHQETGK